MNRLQSEVLSTVAMVCLHEDRVNTLCAFRPLNGNVLHEVRDLEGLLSISSLSCHPIHGTQTLTLDAHVVPGRKHTWTPKVVYSILGHSRTQSTWWSHDHRLLKKLPV